jgi:glucose/arabinose dehydrogenase
MRNSLVFSVVLAMLFGQVSNSALADAAHALIFKKNTPLSEQPFWRRRPALMQKIREDREIVVAVRKEDIPNDQIRFTMAGAGMVAKPKNFCFGISQQYSRLKEISDHFKTVSYESSTNQLFLVTEALGYQARMLLKILPVTEDWRSELQWEVVWGHFKGMTGLIGFEKLDDSHTEMSFNARYEASELPLPRILMGFALEVITKKVAEKMRAFIESQPASALETKNDPKALPGLDSIKLPQGFTISLFSQDLPGARQMAFSPTGTLFVGTQAGKIFAIENAADSAAKGERAKPAKIISGRDLGFQTSNGVAFANGSLYVGDVSRILRFDDIEKNLTHPLKPSVIRDDYPKDTWHGWRYIAVGPDGWLYVPVGMPCNVCRKDDKIYGTITRLSLDGKKREIFSTGVRNSVGFDWDPKTKQLWFTDNGRDLLGDDIPSDELNHARKLGMNFGFPFCHQGDLKDPEFGIDVDCTKFTPPEVKLGAHVASLGMKFYSGKQFPSKYQRQVFIAEHGSWNRSKKVGYRIVNVPINSEGHAGPSEVFADGWMQNELSWGRPVDVVVAPDGSLLVSDDENGAIYRIAYTGAK